MSHNDRLTLIAQGLPIILDSARGFWAASLDLKDKPREAEVLSGFAEEEAAKILILMDMVRCPQKLVSSRVSTIVSWFYDHLARLIYAEALRWKPMHIQQLREYVDSQRKNHYLDGYAGEYIFPNWNVFRRESQLYADIEAHEDGLPRWNTPRAHINICPFFVPSALRVAEALSAVGIFNQRGLVATAEIFEQLEFRDAENPRDAQRLTEELLKRLIAERLPTEAASDDHVDHLYHTWQMPMYSLDLSPIHVPLAELQKERDTLLWRERT
jgi:hypothetical protein